MQFATELGHDLRLGLRRLRRDRIDPMSLIRI